MKILAIYCDEFSYKTALKNLESAETVSETISFKDIQIAFIQIEEHDTEKPKSSEKKLLNFVKWVARNNKTKKILLHSFAHLSDSKASPEFTKEIFDNVEKRLHNADYEAFQTPFGYFLDLNINAPGFSMARVFKSF